MLYIRLRGEEVCRGMVHDPSNTAGNASRVTGRNASMAPARHQTGFNICYKKKKHCTTIKFWHSSKDTAAHTRFVALDFYTGIHLVKHCLHVNSFPHRDSHRVLARFSDRKCKTKNGVTYLDFEDARVNSLNIEDLDDLEGSLHVGLYQYHSYG